MLPLGKVTGVLRKLNNQPEVEYTVLGIQHKSWEGFLLVGF
jgi:hypothetical protein